MLQRKGGGGPAAVTDRRWSSRRVLDGAYFQQVHSSRMGLNSLHLPEPKKKRPLELEGNVSSRLWGFQYPTPKIGKESETL